MPNLIAIKNVKRETWQLFKSESARHNLKMGEFLERLLREHIRGERIARMRWNRIFTHKPLLTARQAKAVEAEAREFRKGFAFREFA
jgi:hypothetical protein